VKSLQDEEVLDVSSLQDKGVELNKEDL